MPDTIDLETITLTTGAHGTRDEGVCLMEAAGAASWAAARDAAGDAAGAGLAPVVKELQADAIRLFGVMISA